MSGKINLKRWLAAFTFLLATWCTAASARTIYVDDDGPADFSTIQAAIDDSNDGDTIIVQPGLYLEHIGFYGKNITVTSTKPIDFNIVASTIIDYGVVFAGSEEPNCQLVGFNINGTIYGGVNHTHATISHCLLISNTVYKGTVIKNCDGTISNCIVANNWPSGNFIDAAISGCSGVFRNCTVAHNLDGMIVEGTTTIENSIIYQNFVIQQIKGFGTLNVLYSDVEGGRQGIYFAGTVNWGLGNIDEDPNFVYTANRDYHLKSQAGRWEPSSQTWVQDAVTSPCIDAGDPTSPIGNEPFPNGGRINMGAYGGKAEASKSYFGEPPCEIIVAGDINGDCRINFLDFQLIALNWLRDESQ